MNPNSGPSEPVFLSMKDICQSTSIGGLWRIIWHLIVKELPD